MMSSLAATSAPAYVGLDFGTTNSALAVADAGGQVTLATYPRGETPIDVFRSVLCFERDLDRGGRVRALAGPEAIEAYLDSDGDARLILSIKSYLGSRHFTATQVLNRPYTIQELAGFIVRRLRERGTPVPAGGRAVCGRPVRFAHAESAEDDTFAEGRLRAALAAAGLDEVTFRPEPVAAAYHYEQRLTEDELVLTADFGGGTSDLCLMRMGPGARARGHRPEDVLAVDGVALAGDAFDARIIDHVVAPRLGRGGEYVSYLDQDRKRLPIPPWIYGRLRRWHHLSFLKSRENLELLRRLHYEALEPAKIAALLHVVEADLGFRLYRAVERSKVELSSREASRFQFEDGPVVIDEVVTRADFEAWIADDLAVISACVDRVLERAGVAPGEVSRVFMTGGSSFVPAVRREFARRFGAAKLSSGDELTAVAIGLALMARDLGLTAA